MKKFLIGLIGMLLVVAAPITAIAYHAGASEFVANAIGLASIPAVMYLVKKFPTVSMPGVVKNGVEVEVWSEYIASNLFRGIEFLKNCYRADHHVLAGKVVHIPQPGSKPTVVKNRTSLPAVAVKRADTDVVYSLDEYTTDPTVIEDAANVQLSYDKMDSVLGDHIGALNESVADDILYAWAPTVAGSIIRTTGANVLAHMPAATGNRKAFTLSDLKKARIVLNKQKVLKTLRYCIMSDEMWSQLEEELKATNSKDYSAYNDAREGVIGKLYGFEIVTTTTVVTYDNAAVPQPKAVGAVGATTDNDAVYCYQKNHLELALGDIKFFENNQDATYYGDVYSGLVRMGGRKRYTGQQGIVAIVQTP